MSPPHHLDLRLLATLAVLLDVRSVSKAAERLSVSQPAMSRILARLRDQFDDLLLVRGGNGMTLTPRAESLREPLRDWLRQGAAMLHPPAFTPLTLQRTFRIASTDFGIISVVTPAMQRLWEKAPGASLAVEPLSTDSLRHLAAGDLDLVVTGYRPEGTGIHVLHLFDEDHLGLARADHPAETDDLTVEEFLKWPQVAAIVGEGYGDYLEDSMSELQDRRVLVSAGSFSAIPYLIADSDALAILPSRAARKFADVHGHRVFELPVRPPPFEYFLAWHERSLADEATLWLVDQMGAAFGEDAP